MVRDALTLVLGVLTGVLSGAFGVGGAVLSTPGIRLLGASALEAVGTTLPSILPSAAAGTARYAKEGLVDWGVVAATAPAGVVGAVLGSLGSHGVPGEGHWLMVVTAVLIGFTAVRMLQNPEERPAREREPRKSLIVLSGTGLGAGALSGLLGVGGGTVFLPAFLELVRLPTKVAVATSLACVGLLAIPSTVTHAFLRDIDWRFAVLLAIAVVPGARLGAVLSIRAGDRRLRLAVAILLGILAVGYGVTELRSALR